MTARMGHPFVKQHVEERELTVILLIDASASGNFGTINSDEGRIGGGIMRRVSVFDHSQ